MVRNFRTLAAVFDELKDPSCPIALGSCVIMLSLGKAGGYRSYWLKWDMESEADGVRNDRSYAELWRVTADGSPYVHLRFDFQQGL